MTQTAEKTADVQAQDYKVADMSLDADQKDDDRSGPSSPGSQLRPEVFT